MTTNATPKLLRLHFDQRQSSHCLVHRCHKQSRTACQRTLARIRKRIRSAVQCEQVNLPRSLFRSDNRDSARETTQTVESSKKGRADHSTESRMVRPVRADVRTATLQQFSVMQRAPSTALGMTVKLSLAFFVATTVFAQSDSQFTKANQEYGQGNFKEAIAGYETLIRAGQWNANLFYDLGNAYFRTADFGRAILNYERTLALDHRHPEAIANLQIARDEGRALELRASPFERYLQFATANQYSTVAAAAFWLAIFALAAMIFARRRSTAVLSLSILCLLVCAIAVWAIHTLDNG